MHGNLSIVPPWVSREMFALRKVCPRAYFHDEILGFMDWIQMSEAELKKRYDLLAELEMMI